MSANSAALGHIVLRPTVIAVVAFFVSYALVSLALHDPDYAAEFNSLPAGRRAADITMLSVLVVGIATFAILVRWHRLIIKQSPPDASRKGAARAGFLYFARSVMIGAIGPAAAIVGGLLPAVLLQRAAVVPSDSRALTAALVAIALACALAVAARLSLILPAAAIGDGHVTMRASWQLTRGNSWRMLLGSALAAGPAAALTLVVNGFDKALPTMSGNTTSLMLVVLFSLALTVITGVIQASFLSYAYLFFTKDNSA